MKCTCPNNIPEYPENLYRCYCQTCTSDVRDIEGITKSICKKCYQIK